MKTCCYFLTLLFVVFGLNSCSNEIDVLADYEENAVVYGLLDPTQPVQFIKINKVFTNPGASASDIAKIADSLYFDSVYNLKLVEVGTGREIKLTKANVLLKDAGYFASSPNYLYATTEKISSKQDYRVEMDLPQVRKHISATTNIPDPIMISAPSSVFFGSIDIPADKFIVQFNSTIDSKIFDMYFYFSYMEVNKADTNIKVIKTITWRLLNKERSGSDKAPDIIRRVISSSSFYDLMRSSIPVNPSVSRRFQPCKIELVAGNLELDNYIQVTEPSIGIVQKQTEYTNIVNGLGIFASRVTSTYDNLILSSKMKDIIVLENLGFAK